MNSKSGHTSPDEIKKRIRDLIRSLPAFIYYRGYWQLKEPVRHFLRTSAIVYFLASALFLLAEIASEIRKEYIGTIFHRQPINEAVDNVAKPAASGNAASERSQPIWFAPPPPKFDIYQLAYILAVLIIVSHHVHTLRHRNSHFSLNDSLWALLRCRRDCPIVEFLDVSLPLVQRAFNSCGADRVCIWVPRENNGLHIPPGYMFPFDSNEELTSLGDGEGVAGAVLKDGTIHYVARMGIPFNSGLFLKYSATFPFAQELIVEVADDAVHRVKLGRIQTEGMVMKKRWREDSCRAFIAIPLTISGPQIGVMTINFNRTDPIGIFEMQTAASLATIIGDEIVRLRTGSPLNA